MKSVGVNTPQLGIKYQGYLSAVSGDQDTIIIHIHGMAGDYIGHHFYPPMHEAYLSNGISFLVGQHSGSGLSTKFECKRGEITKGTSYEMFEDCIEDIGAWVDYAASLGYKHIWLQGHSLGTPKIAYYLAQTKDPRISGLVLISPSEMVGLVHDPIGQLDYDAMYPEAVELISKDKGETILKHPLWENVPMSAKTFISLFGEHSKAAVFNYVSPKYGWDVVSSISVPTLAITGTQDDGIETVMEPELAMQILKEQMVNCPRYESKIYEGAKHDFEGYVDRIIEDVVAFVNFRE